MLRVDATLPDVVPNGAHFVRTLTLHAADDAIDVRERAVFGPGPQSRQQRAIRYDSFDTQGATTIDERSDGGVGFFFPTAGYVASVVWALADVEAVHLLPERTSSVVELTFKPDRESRTRYALTPAADLAAAYAAILKERTTVNAKP
jgi:hypothetical protein